MSLHRSNKQQEKEKRFERIQTEHIKSEYPLGAKLILESKNYKFPSPSKHLNFIQYEKLTNFLSQKKKKNKNKIHSIFSHQKIGDKSAVSMFY